MQLQQTLEAIVRPIAASVGYEFVGLEFVAAEDEATGSTIIRIYIDRDAGVDVVDCVKVSRMLDQSLEAEDNVNTDGNINTGASANVKAELEAMDDYTLEVSSPGVNRRLFTLEQCGKQIDRTLELSFLQGSEAVNGKLVGVEGQHLKLEVDSGNGKEELRFDFKDIKQARVVPQW